MNQKVVTAVILAGGASSRMGQNKALMELGGRPMIDRIIEPLRNSFREIIIVTDHPGQYGHLSNVKLVKDIVSGGKKNSLLGIYSGLKAASHPYIFIIACDMPFVNISLIENMIRGLRDEDIVIPYIEPHYEPLYALYHKNCIKAIQGMLAEDNYKITELLKLLRVSKILPKEIKRFDPHMKCFVNVNTYEQYIAVSREFRHDEK